VPFSSYLWNYCHQWPGLPALAVSPSPLKRASSRQKSRGYHKLRFEINDSQPKRLLLSCENFSSRLKTRKEVSRLRDFLSSFASSFRILAYLRRQDKMISSAYSIRIKNGITSPFRFPLEGHERHDSHFDQLLDRWNGELNPLRADIEQALGALNFPGSQHSDYPGNANFEPLPTTVAANTIGTGLSPGGTADRARSVRICPGDFVGVRPQCQCQTGFFIGEIGKAR
jgi:hypothetical protein